MASAQDVRQEVIDQAQCPANVSDLVDQVVNSPRPDTARFKVIVQLRQNITDQNELLVCLQQLAQACDSVMNQNQESGNTKTIGSQIMENLKGALRVLSSIVEDPTKNCGQEGCAMGTLGSRG